MSVNSGLFHKQCLRRPINGDFTLVGVRRKCEQGVESNLASDTQPRGFATDFCIDSVFLTPGFKLLRDNQTANTEPRHFNFSGRTRTQTISLDFQRKALTQGAAPR